ncbi:MAG: class II aldolase/adducin family protein [Chitinophagales bacterium]
MTPIDEGYIKYQIHWQPTATPASFCNEVAVLNYWRTEMYLRNWIGYDSKLKVGFGNISMRTPSKSGRFLISGTQTGHLSELTLQNYALVKDYNIAANELWCEGSTKASSESLTHAAIYELNDDYQSVIHIHCKEMWLQLLHKVPTISANIPYGTPEMAFEIQRLHLETDLAQTKIVAMAGHENGLIAFGKDLKQAANVFYCNATILTP